MERVAEVVRPINEALFRGYVNAARTFAATFTTTRDDYSLAADN